MSSITPPHSPVVTTLSTSKTIPSTKPHPNNTAGYSNVVLSKHDSVQFGWSQKNPPKKFHFKLEARDIENFNDLTPTDNLVARVAEKLVGSNDDAPRFAMLTGVKILLIQDKAIHRFQENLSQRVYDYLNTNYDRFNKENRLREKQHQIESSAVRLGQELQNTVQNSRMRLSRAFSQTVSKLRQTTSEPNKYKKDTNNRYHKAFDMDGTKSLHSLHFDHHYALVSIAYGPFDNIKEGGAPLLADVRQYVRDLKKKPKTMLSALRPKNVKSVANWGIISPSHSTKLKDYTVSFTPFDTQNDRPILLFVNSRDEQGGLAHGVSPITLKNTNRPETRTVHYVSIAAGNNTIDDAS